MLRFGSRPVKAPTLVLEALVLALAVAVLRGYEWPTLSPVEVSPLQAMLDPALFRNDFAVQEAMRFSPRFYANELILLPARAGLPLSASFAVLHLVFLALLAGGVRAFARTVGLGVAAGAVLLVWLVNVGAGSIGAVFFYTHAPVPAVWAGALVVWGAVAAARQRWLAAFAWFGGAVLLQFLVGLYAGLLALPFLLRPLQARRLAAVTPWVAALGLVYGPMRWQGGTDSGVLDPRSFIEIYAYLRHPHHLVPSHWGAAAWFQFVAFYAGAAWYLERTPSARRPLERQILLVVGGTLAAGLALNYVFVELHPVALVGKLQLARLAPLAQVIVLGLLATRVQDRVAARDAGGALLLAVTVLSPQPGGLLILAGLLGGDRAVTPVARLAWGAAVVLSFVPYPGAPASGLDSPLAVVLLFATALGVSSLLGRPTLLATAALASAAAAAWAVTASVEPGWARRPGLSWLAARFAPDAGPFDPPGVIGARFGLRSHPDASVLVPPTGEVWTFKLHARRAVVVDDKNTPFTDRGLREWKERMDAVLGEPLRRDTDPAAAWAARPPDALAATARRYGARYILTRDRWHAQLPGTKVESLFGWSLWQLP